MGVGAMLGDMTGSFIKRRMKLKEGSHALFMDELLFIVFAVLFVLPIADNATVELDLVSLLILACVTFALHKTTNYIANKLGIKKVPW